MGDKVANIVPEVAVAELDIRTTLDSDAKYLGKLVENHVRQQGYFLVEGAPSDEDRAAHDKLASFSYQTAGTDAAATPIDAPVGQWAYQAMAAVSGMKGEPVRIRMQGGTVPTAEIVEALQLPFVIVPVVQSDNNQHTHNENMRLGNYVDGIRTIYSLITRPF